MSDPGATTQVLGKAEEACRECGAQLADDQRYCLNCGARRAEPRIEFERYLPEAGAPGANGAAAAAPPPDGRAVAAPGSSGSQRDYTPLAAVGGIAVLGVMLLIGVLIGKGQDSGTATAPAPVVVQGGEAETDESAKAGGEGSGANAGGGKSGGKSGGKGKSKGAVSGGSADTGSAPVASDAELKALEEQSPQEYSENSAKLPDEIATGGAPPPEDNKAPGGGSGGATIE